MTFELLGWKHASYLVQKHQQDGKKAAAELVALVSGQLDLLHTAGCSPHDAQVIIQIYVRAALMALSRQTPTACIIEPPWPTGFNIQVFRPHCPEPFLRQIIP